MRAPLGGLATIAVLTVFTGSDAAAQGGSFLQTLLRVTGISATPSSQKGPGDELQAGDVWIASRAQGTRLRLTREGGYRSPVFGPAALSLPRMRAAIDPTPSLDRAATETG